MLPNETLPPGRTSQEILRAARTGTPGFGASPEVPRRIRAYCLGAPKSGTHSIAGLFAARYRARHEPEVKSVILALLGAAAGALPEEAQREFLRVRDAELQLEMEASHPLHFFAPLLAEEFPEARFVLTLRDCYSWLHAYINQHVEIQRPLGSHWMRLMDYLLLQDAKGGVTNTRFAPKELAMAEQGLFPLRNYLAYWANHNRYVLESIPAERLLVVRTHEIRQRIPEIAGFLGVPEDSLERSRAHLSVRQEKPCRIVYEVDREYLEAQVELYCRPLMDRFFPEVRSLEDSPLGRGVSVV